MKHIEQAVLARLEVAFAPTKKADKPKPKYGSEKWWKSLSKKDQRQYLKEHPGSKYNPAKKAKKSKNKLVKKKPAIPGLTVTKTKPHTEHQIRMDEKRKMRQAQLRKDIERKKKEAKKKDELRKKAEKQAQEEKKKKVKPRTEAEKKAKQEEDRLAEQYKATKKPEDFEALEEHKTASRTAKFIDWYEESVNKAVDKIKHGTLERIGNVIGADLEDMISKDSHKPPSVRLYDALNTAIQRNEAELDQINEKIAKAKDQRKIAEGKKAKGRNPESIAGWEQKIVSIDELLGRLGVQRKMLEKKVQEGHKQREPLKARADRYHIKESEERDKVRDLRSLGIKTGRAKTGGKAKPTKPKLHKLKRAKR